MVSKMCELPEPVMVNTIIIIELPVDGQIHLRTHVSLSFSTVCIKIKIM